MSKPMLECPVCKEGNLQSRGVRKGIHSLQCNNSKCKEWQRIKVDETSAEVEYGQDYIKVIVSSKRIITEQDVIKQFKINTDDWERVRFIVKTSEGYRKDRSVNWDVKDGTVTRGKVRDSGKMLVVPMFHCHAEYRRKTAEIRERKALEELIKTYKNVSPKYPTIKYPKIKNGMMFEVELPDLQLGRLVMEEEAAIETNVALSIKRAEDAMVGLMSHVIGKPIERILFPLGHDFFDANNSGNATAHGTQMQDDIRWQRVFIEGQKMVVRLIDMLCTVAPVYIPIIPGNHDEERIFFLGNSIESYYRHNKNVTIDNQPRKRKYYSYGKCLLGLTHGYYEKIEELSALMAMEVPDLWAKSRYREFHLGHRHHKKDIIFKTQEANNGVVVRLLRSLATPSVWEFDKGLVGSLKASEGFLWHPEKGLIAQYTSSI